MWACFKYIRIILLGGYLHQCCVLSALENGILVCIETLISRDIRTSTSTFLSYYEAYKLPSAGWDAPHCLSLVVIELLVSFH